MLSPQNNVRLRKLRLSCTCPHSMLGGEAENCEEMDGLSGRALLVPASSVDEFIDHLTSNFVPILYGR